MFDFSKMDSAFAAMGELDGLLKAILAEQRTTNMLLAMGLSVGNMPQGGVSYDEILTMARNSANGPDART